ncbi:MAG: tRNA-binding protein [Candidatus Moraniibacteriota bacterium]
MEHKIMISCKDFEKVDIRVGRILEIKDFPEGKYSTHILRIDFGQEVGVKTSLAKLAPNYHGDELVGKEIVGVVNLKPKQIGKYMSETLTLGLADEAGNVILLHPGKDVPIGGKLY